MGKRNVKFVIAHQQDQEESLIRYFIPDIAQPRSSINYDCGRNIFSTKPCHFFEVGNPIVSLLEKLQIFTSVDQKEYKTRR